MTDTTGQIGLVRTKGFWGWVIRKITASPVNHVVVGISPTQNIGAEPGGVRIRRNDEWDQIIWSEFDLTTREKYVITRFVRDRLTYAYSYLTDFAIGMEYITGIPTPTWLERYLSSDYVYECAQLAHAAYLAARKNILEDDKYRLPGRVNPGTFVPVWKKNGWKALWW